MTELQMRAIHTAVKMLNSIGVQYAVLLPSGEKLGALDVAPPKGATKRSPIHDHVRKHNYIDIFDATKNGQQINFLCDTKDEAESLRGSVVSRSVRSYGPQGCISHLESKDGKYEVSVLVLSDKAPV